MKINAEQLISHAKEAREQAYAPYSKFHVGAALLCKDGSIYTGCNIENAAYPAGICAERTAVCKAVSEGKQNFLAIAIVGAKAIGQLEVCAPCGICRQVLAEFVKEDFIFILGDNNGYQQMTMGELLPLSFSGESLH
jgi:cytidine deaminase